MNIRYHDPRILQQFVTVFINMSEYETYEVREKYSPLDLDTLKLEFANATVGKRLLARKRQRRESGHKVTKWEFWWENV